jgi:hypothetical protein
MLIGSVELDELETEDRASFYHVMHKILQGLAYFHGTCGYQFEL